MTTEFSGCGRPVQQPEVLERNSRFRLRDCSRSVIAHGWQVAPTPLALPILLAASSRVGPKLSEQLQFFQRGLC